MKRAYKKPFYTQEYDYASSMSYTNLIIKCRIGYVIIFLFIKAKNFSIALATVQFFNEEKMKKN